MADTFWEPMACNLDGIIDLGEDRKVELFMNLLGQIKINNDEKVKIKIPNIEEIVKFIDDVVCLDIFKWKDIIKSSNYLSLKMQSKIFKLINDKKEDYQLKGMEITWNSFMKSA